MQSKKLMLKVFLTICIIFIFVSCDQFEDSQMLQSNSDENTSMYKMELKNPSGDGMLYTLKMKTSLTDLPSDLVIPSEVNTYPVQALDRNAFAGYTFSSITVPTSVVFMDMFAFGSCSVITINLPSSLQGAYLITDAQLLYY